VTGTETSAERLRGVLGDGVAVTTDAVAAVQGADVVMIGVKPPKVVGLVQELSAHLVPGVTLVSLAAGVTSPTSSRSPVGCAGRARHDEHARAHPRGDVARVRAGRRRSAALARSSR
jgi:predicted dinucleotide-binding enzyme